MTDDTEPEAREFTMSQYASKDDMIGAMRKRIAELESELEAVGAGGVSGPLMGIAALSANAGEPVAWQYRSLRDNGAWFDCTKERFEMRCTQPEIWETRALYAAPPTAQAEGWTKASKQLPPCREDQLYIGINTAGFAGVFNAVRVVNGNTYCLMEVAEESVSIMSDLAIWKPFNPPTSAEGVEHG